MKPSKNRHVAALSLGLAGDEPPTEFRIFTAGVVDTVKGQFVFDEEAAESVIAEYNLHGIDLPIDYDHASLSSDSSPDPSKAGRAAGWCELELREGELWATNVRWCAPAAEALRHKEWRFMSPAFQTKGDRIVSVMNIALTNLPASRRLEPLMAASVTAEGETPMTLQDALAALEAGDMATALEIIKALLLAGETAPVAPGQPAPGELEITASRLQRMTQCSSNSDALAEVGVWRASHLKLEAETMKLAKERATLELSKRKENAVTLTKLGAETPFTSGLGKGKLCQRLADEPLEEQNARVAALLSARGGKLPITPRVPLSSGDDVGVYREGEVTVTQREIDDCKRVGADLETYVRNKAVHLKAKAAAGGAP